MKSCCNCVRELNSEKNNDSRYEFGLLLFRRILVRRSMVLPKESDSKKKKEEQSWTVYWNDEAQYIVRNDNTAPHGPPNFWPITSSTYAGVRHAIPPWAAGDSLVQMSYGALQMLEVDKNRPKEDQLFELSITIRWHQTAK